VESDFLLEMMRRRRFTGLSGKIKQCSRIIAYCCLPICPKSRFCLAVTQERLGHALTDKNQWSVCRG
jgi:hypothetical protein